ncbi:fumarate reductase subunit C [Nonomuraea sp. K274]|uniref:Fumarate reductase subunit C n=1 Tax=Nonomuraea cypriaca TaxID=1187855 RepID=A0A931F256_9ACTN|nr:fumarate reductase subunit C [Nonomuraea cypriaca]MBF8192604.1 fumarate reductase subunit C [Nonomuraea cypriaca]
MSDEITPSAAVRTTSDAYRPPRDHLWFARSRHYIVFVLRELTSVFVAWSIVFLLMLVGAVLGGGLQEFAALAARPWMIAINVLTLAATVFHAVTFLNLAPKATVVRLDDWRVPAWMIQGGNHTAWLLISALIAYFVLRSP